MKKTARKAAAILLCLILTGCWSARTAIDDPLIPTGRGPDVPPASLYLEMTEDEALLALFDPLPGRSLYAKTAYEEAGEERIELISHVEDQGVLLRREMLTLIPMEHGWLPSEYAREELPPHLPISTDYRSQSPILSEDIQEEEIARFLNFATGYSAACSGMNFTNPAQLSDAEKYQFFCFIQSYVDRLSGVEGAESLESILYHPEEDAVIVPVPIMQEYLHLYLGVSEFDPVSAFGLEQEEGGREGKMPYGYNPEHNAYVTPTISGFGGGRFSGLLAEGRLGDVLTLHVGFYDSDPVAAHPAEYKLLGWVEMQVRTGEDPLDFTLLRWVTTLLNEDGTQSVVDTPNQRGQKVELAEAEAERYEMIFATVYDGSVRGTGRNAFWEEDGLTGGERLTIVLKDAAEGKPGAAGFIRMTPGEEALFHWETDDGGERTLARILRRGERWLQVESWTMAPPEFTEEGIQLYSVNGALRILLPLPSSGE